MKSTLHSLSGVNRPSPAQLSKAKDVLKRESTVKKLKLKEQIAALESKVEKYQSQQVELEAAAAASASKYEERLVKTKHLLDKATTRLAALTSR